MLRIQNISAANQQRTLRALYAQTQAYPYAAVLSTSVYTAAGTATGTAFSKGSGTATGTAGNGPIMPGMIAALAPSGEQVCIATGGTALPLFGLFGNFIGGDFDEVGDFTEVGVWRGPAAVFEVLSPAFNSNITSSNDTDASATSANSRKLYPDANGVLNASAVSSGPAVARLIDYVSSSKIVIELLSV
jgi:hypothetical protein